MSAIFNYLCRKCSLALIFMLFLQSADAQDFNNLQTILKSNAKNLGKQYTIVVQKGGKNIFLSETDELKLKIPTAIGHASAWISAALVMTFIDQKKLSLDDPIAKYLPEFKKNMKGYITVAHCLTQTTGLDADASGIVKVAQKNKFLNLDEEVSFYATKKLIVDNPGEAFSYSNVGLNILGKVMEIISKKSFDRLAAERIFRPLGMRTASFFNEDGNAPNPTSGATCSAFDYLNFMQMIANKGLFNGKQVLSEHAVNTLLTIHHPDLRIRYTPENTKGFKYTMGSWAESTDENGKGIVFSSLGPTGAITWFDSNKKYFAAILSSELQNSQRFQLINQIRRSIEESVE
ncbi:MAG: serine hydrolase domain-containing protein [Chitinophagaceae bacterium]